MVSIRRRRIGNENYFYLEHTIRVDNKVEKKEVYLGKSIPKDIEKIKMEFISDVYKKRWNPILHKIHRKFKEEQSKTPLSSKKSELDKFSVRFTYDTQRIEGSTLSFKDTSDLIEKGITPNKKLLNDVKEAEAHDSLFHEMILTKQDITLSLVLEWHRNLFLSTRPEIAGKIRQHQVMISRSKFVPPFPSEIMPLIMEFFDWYNANKKILHPVELAALTHLKFVTIHPFSDGNGRISRLLMNFILHKHNYPLFNIRYEKRGSYYTALERAQTKSLDLIFVQWFMKIYIKEHQ